MKRTMKRNALAQAIVQAITLPPAWWDLLACAKIENAADKDSI